MTRYSIALLIALFMGILMTSTLGVSPASANYPHLPEFGVDCTPCHFGSGGTYPNDTDCLTCHDGSASIEVVGHSSATTSEKYGTWNIECTTCHTGMYQYQYWTYRPESYIFDGVSDPEGVTEYSLTMTGANWAPDEFTEYQLIPNIVADGTYSYRIIGNTEDTLFVDEPIYLPVVTTGDTSFVII